MSIETEILIFLHIPKVGGMTLSKILERHYSPAQTLNFDAGDNQQKRFEAIPAPQRARSRLIKGHLFFGLHRCIEGPSVYVTFLREPVERVLSFYRYARSDPGHYLHDLLMTDGLDLKRSRNEDLNLELCNEQTRMLAGDEWEDPQRPVTRAALQRAQENLRTYFRMVGLTEEFDASVMLLHQTFGWPPVPYMKENVTNNKPDDTSIDPETRKFIEESNTLDIELYEYARELFNDRRHAAGKN
jgi:hypothetical protein